MSPLLLLAQDHHRDPTLLRSAFSLWVATALLALLGLAVLVLVARAARRRRARVARANPRPASTVTSAWEEAGRRAQAITVDLDPPPNPEDGPDGLGAGGAPR